MSSIPVKFATIKDGIVTSSKQLINDYKGSLGKFANKATTIDHQQLINEDDEAQIKYEVNEASNLYGYHATGLNVHRNALLHKIDQFSCCQCQKRWQLSILANLGFMIVFGIRCNFGAAKNHMARNYTDPWGEKHISSFHWSRAELGIIESSFFYGYFFTQIPGGFLAAKFAPNILFGLAIGLASFLNLILPFGFNSRSLFLVVVIQIAQGFVQGVSYPAMHGVWRFWAPPMERSKLATTAFTGSYAGAVVGLPLSAWLVFYLHWSAPFYFYGVCGVIWSIFWFTMAFEKPAFHPTISHEEKEYIERHIGHVSASHPTLKTVPWKAILLSKPVYAIVVANFARSWTFYLLLTSQLTFMKDVYKTNINEVEENGILWSGFESALPHAVMAFVVLIGGQLADYLRSNGILSTTAVRKLFNCGGFGGEALFLLVVAYTRSEKIAVFGLILAVGFSGFAISGFNVNHLDIAPRYAAILMGFSNGIGTLAGMTCAFITEQITAKQRSLDWEKVFLIASLIHFTGITFYFFFASGELQDWAEPKDEQEQWRSDDFAQKASNAEMMISYGTMNDSICIPRNCNSVEPSEFGENDVKYSHFGVVNANYYIGY